MFLLDFGGTLVNRSGGNPYEDLGLELIALAEVTVETWDPSEAPLRMSGSVAVKPGSKSLNETGGGAG